MTAFALTQDAIDPLLDTLLPGSDFLPPASCTGTGAEVLMSAKGVDAARAILAALPPDFADLATPGRAAAVREVARLCGAVQALVEVAHRAYYSDPDVSAAVARLAAYRHPPRPAGPEMPPFDPSILDTVRKAAPAWRDPRPATPDDNAR
ncbi:hypothetical protein [Acuticoccus sediminis]|uniref:hypothetical protein n=1 Tax=Acuticoccus sediminis TaxID=2184697 RepID=UPI001391615C|nr:hypothetical protein [Acuticoccus sediminis]